MPEQFLAGVPEDLSLRIWLLEGKMTSLCQAATLAGDHALARRSSQMNSGRPVPPPTSSHRYTRFPDNSNNM